MKAKLAIVCCVLAALCLAVAVVIGMLFDFVWMFACLGGAAVFAGLMFLFKLEKPAPPDEKPDFMKSDEENERINQKHKDE